MLRTATNTATKTATVAIASLGLAASAIAFAAPAGAVTDYSSCDAMHKVWKNGVAKNKKAANKQWNTGHKRPAVKPAVYQVNDESDADNDGTASEVER